MSLVQLVAGFVFLVGAATGSFAGVVIWRLPRRESLLHPPSHCGDCGHRLFAWENVPIAAWLVLGGRCRRCGTQIGVRYWLLELWCAVAPTALILSVGLTRWWAWVTVAVMWALPTLVMERAEAARLRR